MLNRIAPIHLLFVASILLFFFAFMGYRMRSPSLTDESADVSSVDLASLSGEAETSPLRPSGPSSSPVASSLPAGLQAVAEAAAEEAEEWIPSRRETPSASLAPAATTGMRPPPSSPAPGATSHSGSIAGLVPGMPLTPPGGGSDVEAADEPPAAEESSLPSLPLPGDQLRPSSESTPVRMPLPPSPSADGTSGSSDAETSTRPQSRAASLVPPPVYAGEVEGEVEDDEEEYEYEDEFPASTPQLAMRPGAETRTANPSPPARSEPEPRVIRNDLPPRPARNDAATGTLAPREPSSGSETTRIYVVRPGDTLSSIAARELGSASLADNIFLGNRGVIHDPDQLMVGAKIRLPVREGLSMGDDYSPATPSGGIAPPPRKPTQGLGRVHMVARGDTLSSIAQHYYGTSANWRFLYEANKGVMANPNQLSVGMELVIPPYEGSQGNM